MTENKDETVQNVANVMKSRETLEFINQDNHFPELTRLAGEKELIKKQTQALKWKEFLIFLLML